jgi:hypothetical protein
MRLPVSKNAKKMHYLSKMQMITGRHKFATKHGESSKNNNSSVFSDADFVGWAKDHEQRTLAKKRRLRL